MDARIELHTDRLILRALNRNDILPLRDAISQSADTVGRWLDWCHADFNETDARIWISESRQHWTADRRYEMALIHRETGALLGCLCFYSIDRVANLANLGYWVISGAQRQGYMMEALKRAVRFAFEKLVISRIEIVMDPGNDPSRLTAEKLGAQFECKARNRYIFNDQVRDGLLYSLIPADLGIPTPSPLPPAKKVEEQKNK